MKLLIIGAVGSGKTTLAKKMSAAYGVPTYQLEKIAYEVTTEGRRKRSKKELLVLLAKIDLKGDWILEGIPDKAYDFLYGWADRIFWLDPPADVRRKRILKRFVKRKFAHGQGEISPSLMSLGGELWKNQRADTARYKNKLAKALQPYAKKVTHITSADKVIIPPKT